MEKIQNNRVGSNVSSPLPTKGSSFGDISVTDKPLIRATINLSGSDWVGFENGLIKIVNPFSTKTINPKFYNVIGTTETQKQLLNTLKPQEQQEKPQEKKPIKVKMVSSGLDGELKQLDNLTHLAKKFKTFCNQTEKLRSTVGDKKILLERSLEKSKILLSKYLNELKSDSRFQIQGEKLVFSGEFVQATKVIGNLGGF
jgi:hypothetical protein